MAALRRALLAQVTEGDVAEVARKLLERAKSGDLTAVKLLFAYAIGRPGEAVDPDTLDVHELRCYREGARLADTGTAALKSIQPDYLCELLRIALPCVRHDQAAMIAEQLQETVGGRET